MSVTILSAFAFPKSHRLLTQRDFRSFRHHAKKVIGKYLIMRINKSRHSSARLGISASRKYGKAHIRNRFKRLVRESFRLGYIELDLGYDMVIAPRKEAIKATLQEIMVELNQLLKQGSEETPA